GRARGAVGKRGSREAPGGAAEPARQCRRRGHRGSAPRDRGTGRCGERLRDHPDQRQRGRRAARRAAAALRALLLAQAERDRARAGHRETHRRGPRRRCRGRPRRGGDGHDLRADAAAGGVGGMSRADALTAGLFALPTLAWAVVTRQLWLHRRVRPEPSPLFGPAVGASGLITLHGAMHVVEVFLPVGIGGGTAFAALRDATLLGATVVGRHALRDMQLPESRPGRRWLVTNYGLLPAFALPALGLIVLRGGPTAWQRVGYASLWVGIATMAVLCRQQAVRMARPAVWGPEHAG